MGIAIHLLTVFRVEFLGIRNAFEVGVRSLHVCSNENTVIAVSADETISVWDIVKLVQIRTWRREGRGSGRSSEGKFEISAAIFSADYQQLLVAASTLKVWQATPSEEFLFKERKMQSLYAWRTKAVKEDLDTLQLKDSSVMIKQLAAVVVPTDSTA